MYKRMISLQKDVDDRLVMIASGKGITVQELLRCIIIPEYLESEELRVIVEPPKEKSKILPNTELDNVISK